MVKMTEEERWRSLLTGEYQNLHRLRRVFDHAPSPPRCKLCHAPFHGVGGVVLKPWFGQWSRNTQLCKSCVGGLVKSGVSGGEIALSFLFVDVRGSTGLGEQLSPADFTRLLAAFYRIAADAIVVNDGVVDKFVGDEAIGLFIPGFAGTDHVARAIAAGREILVAVDRPDASPTGPIPVGGGVHTGVAYVGNIGSSEAISGFTALGDPVNATARLASLAAAGELLVSVAAADAAHLDTSDLERRSVEVRGSEAGLDVYVIRPTTALP